MKTYTKIWVGDKCPSKDDTYYWADTVNKAKNFIVWNEKNGIPIEEINISDNGIDKPREADGGTIKNFEKWLKDTNRQYKIMHHRIS